MKWIERIAISLLCLGMVCFCLCFAPSSEVIAGPKAARLAVRPEHVPLKAFVYWSDLVLNNEGSIQTVDFDDTGTAYLPLYKVQTNLGRRLLKHGLGLFDIIPGCDHCNAPHVRVVVEPPPYLKQEGFWLAQKEISTGTTVVFETYLTVDETQQPVRHFSTSDSPGLLSECMLLLTKGDRNFVPIAEWGPLMNEVAPLRVEIKRGTALLWMGGDIGYTVPARPAHHRSIGSDDVFPTKYLEISQIQRQNITRIRAVPLPGSVPGIPSLPSSKPPAMPGP